LVRKSFFSMGVRGTKMIAMNWWSSRVGEREPDKGKGKRSGRKFVSGLYGNLWNGRRTGFSEAPCGKHSVTKRRRLERQMESDQGAKK